MLGEGAWRDLVRDDRVSGEVYRVGGIAERMERDFVLVYIVRSGEEEGIEEDFGRYIA